MSTAMADARTALFGLGNGRTADAFQCTAVDGRKLLCGLQERHRVHRAPIDAHFIMKMASGGPAGGTHAGDHVAALHLLAFTDQNLGKMPIARFNAPAMGKVDHVAIAAAPARLDRKSPRLNSSH